MNRAAIVRWRTKNSPRTNELHTFTERFIFVIVEKSSVVSQREDEKSATKMSAVLFGNWKQIKITLFLLLFVTGIVVVCCFIRNVSVGIENVYRNDSDIHWINDSVTNFIRCHKRLPENWQELKSAELMQPITGIEQRVEINFDLCSQINKDKELCQEIIQTNDDVWTYRFCAHPHFVDKQFNMKYYCRILCGDVPKE